MGGRGASTGLSENGNKYGSQYKTIFKSGNIKFLEARPGAKEQLLETMTAGRVYVLVQDGSLKQINYYDKENKRSKRVDLDHSHRGMKPHVQHGYYGTEETAKAGATRLTTEERKMVDRVLKLWDNHKSK